MYIISRTNRYEELTQNREYFAQLSSVHVNCYEIVTDYGFMGYYPVNDFDILWKNLENVPERS